MADSLDEPSTSYGLIAEWASYPPDYSSVTFKLRDEARWQDGTPITPDDVIYSLGVNKDANPRMGLYYKNVSRAEATGPNEVTFYFDVKNNRELPMIMGQLTILPKHYWTGKDASGNQRDPMKTTLEPPLGSGPYRIKDVKPGRSIAYERVADYWGKDLPVNKGAVELRRDPLRLLPRRDGRLRELQGGQSRLLAGDERQELGDGLRLRRRCATATSSARRCRSSARSRCSASCSISGVRNSQDRRVRQAFNLAFDFEWANKNLFYGQYARVGSYFQGSELAAPAAPPQGRELEILNEVKDGVPPEVFTEVHANPVNATARRHARANLRKAAMLLKEAGYEVKNGVLTDTKTGQPLKVEFLLVSPLFERIVQPYVANLDRLGIKSSAAHGRFGAIHAAAQRVRLRHRGRQFRPVGFARQRAARFLGLGGGRPRGQPEPDRRQGARPSTS